MWGGGRTRGRIAKKARPVWVIRKKIKVKKKTKAAVKCHQNWVSNWVLPLPWNQDIIAIAFTKSSFPSRRFRSDYGAYPPNGYSISANIVWIYEENVSALPPIFPPDRDYSTANQLRPNVEKTVSGS